MHVSLKTPLYRLKFEELGTPTKNSQSGRGQVTTAPTVFTYGIEEDSEEKFSSSNALVQLLRASRVLIIEYSVGEEPTGLARQYLEQKGINSNSNNVDSLFFLRNKKHL